MAAVGAAALFTDVFTDVFTGVFTDVFTDVFPDVVTGAFTGAFTDVFTGVLTYSLMYSLTFFALYKVVGGGAQSPHRHQISDAKDFTEFFQRYAVVAVLVRLCQHLIPIKRLRYLIINSTDLGVLSVNELSMDLPVE